ncbi:sensor histidine kinase [Niabella hirudinis]|uniref:sensor histidine kinase n=1 Tax=Niabella hirudinis TaxID=1285929 RepID=UPI003EBD90D7
MLQRTLFLGLITLLAVTKTFSQRDAQNLLRISKICDSLNAIEAYNETLKTARYALTIVPPTDYYNLSLFNFYIGACYQGKNGDTSILYLEKSLSYARRSGKPKRIINALERLLYMYSAMDGYARKRDGAAREALYIIDTTRNNVTKRQFYNALNKYYEILGLREQQMNVMLAELESFKEDLKLNRYDGADSSNIGVCYINIAGLYIDLKQPQKALEYLRPSKIFINQYKVAILHFYKNTADAYLQLFQPGTARLYYDSLTNFNRKEYGPPDDRNNNWDIRMLSDLSFSDYYLKHKKIDSALLYMNTAQALIGASVIDTLQVAGFNYQMGKTLVAAKNHKAAFVYLKNAEKAGLDMGPEQYADVLGELAKCYAVFGQWQMAANCYARYVPIKDSLYAVTTQQSLANAEARFQNKEKQQQINAQQRDLGYARQQRWWFIIGLGLTGLIAVLYIIIYRNKKRTADLLDENNKKLSQLNNDLEEANRTKAKLFSIIGHDLRSPVKQVYQYLKLQKLNVHTEEEKAERADKIEAATESLLEMMEDLLLWSKTQMNELKPGLKPIELLPALQPVERLAQLSVETKAIRFENDIAPGIIVIADFNFLQTIYRNLLQNAIKASPQGGTIMVTAHIKNGSTILSIQNSGRSFTQEDFEKQLQSGHTTQTLNGLGLQLVQELSEKMNATVCFTSTGDNGTIAAITFAAGH